MALQCRIFSVQYGGIMNLVVLNICWLVDTKPHKERAMTILETFNEIFMLISLYALPLFTDWVTDPKIQYAYGWIFVYTLGPLFMINIGFVIMLAFEMVSKKFKLRGLNKRIKLKKEADLIIFKEKEIKLEKRNKKKASMKNWLEEENKRA